eukprot:TRINITY_DN4098_c0_g1_i1.p2 TRINITY_DN4098_c0_g1~~TRINITY_DN4098_c0_g1_i1.p2  ORF type:complete len:393 (+),score=182.82 TRINITY_DN4098_c0_g1_i1:143-1180(+)
MQTRLDQIFAAYVNEHNEEKRVQLHADVDQIFSELTDDVEKVNLFKYLPASLTTNHIVEALSIELKEAGSEDLGVSKMLKSTLANTDFEDVTEKKKALLLLHECLRKTDEKQAQASLLDLLQLCTSDDASPLPGYDLEVLAARAVLNHFKYAMKMGQEPESWQFDTICGLRPVQKLLTSKTKEHRLLHDLLFNVFALGKCSEYMSFYAQNKELIETKWKLKNDELTSKVRTLALCTLCSESSTVRYSNIANKLCITPEEVEMFVIDAMSLGLLNAKIDSMAQTVTVKAVHHPHLEHGHWVSLSERLLAWYSAVSTLITTLDEVRVQQVKEDRDADRLEGPVAVRR